MSISKGFASAGLTIGHVNAIVEKLGGHDGAMKFLRDEITVVEPKRPWREKDGAIYFSVTSDGTTGEEWIKRLEKKDARITHFAKSVLRSKDFQPTSGVTTEIAIINGGISFGDSDRITRNIRAFAAERKLVAPNPEVACLIGEKFSDEDIEELGLWGVLAMQESVKDSDGTPILLGVSRGGGGRWLYAIHGKPDTGWECSIGFAFVAPGADSQT